MTLLGPLEGRIMREVWDRHVPEEFVVQDVRDRMLELAYTTVMSTVSRLADKGLLIARRISGQRAYSYRAAGDAETFLASSGNRQVRELLDRYGDVALAAFAQHVDKLTPAQRERFRKLGQR